MCGRFTLTTPAARLARALKLSSVPDFVPRFNIAPTQMVLTVRSTDQDQIEVLFLRWGLIPAWAKDEKIGNQLLNARMETVTSKPAYRSAFKKRRCLIPADGFYEWQKAGKKKQPYWFHRPDRSPFFFAGLWEHCDLSPEKSLETCTLLTTSANETVKPMHERMPLVVVDEQAEQWLDPKVADADWLQKLAPCPADFFVATAVTDRVNSPKHEDASCIEPAEAGGLFEGA
jgi:putative SOS response-associated peptidase YedK